MAHSIKPYDIVRITRISGVGPQGIVGTSLPAVGDTACVIEIYAQASRLGYELECVSANGETQWVATFAAEDVGLEYVGPALAVNHPRTRRVT